MATHFRIAGLLFCLFDLPLTLADDDADPAQAIHATSEKHADNAELAGVKTQFLQALSKPLEINAQGKVIDLAPLLSVRQQYLAARAQQDGAHAKYLETEQNLQRTRTLHAQDIVATRRLQEQQALWHSDKANLAAVNLQQQAILASSRLQWGELLTQWFTQASDKTIKGFLQGHKQLISVTMPASQRTGNPPAVVYVDEHGKRDQAAMANLIASAPQVDPVSLGQQVFYQLENRALPFGAPVSVWLSDHSETSHGVLIPETAVVWHLGQAFVFIKNADAGFSRRSLQHFSPAQGGYFTPSSVQPGDEIVISGAQTLLSQELKNLIPSEDDD